MTNRRGNVEAVTNFIFEGSKITAMLTAALKFRDGFSLKEKLMINLDSVLKNRYITLPTKIHIVKAMVFPVVIYRCESWTIKAERRRIDALNCSVGEDS